MRMSQYLLLCSAGMLIGSVVLADLNLNKVIEIIRAYNHSVNQDKESYIDSAEQFKEGPGRCGEKFFCAVHDILHKHSNSTHHEQDVTIVRNLNIYNKRKHINCPKVLRNVANVTKQVTLDVFLSHIVECIQCRNLNSQTKSC